MDSLATITVVLGDTRQQVSHRHAHTKPSQYHLYSNLTCLEVVCNGLRSSALDTRTPDCGDEKLGKVGKNM